MERESREGKQIVIVGNDLHPEVEGIKGWCETPAIVINTEQEAEKLYVKPDTKLCIVSQTTFNYKQI